MSKNKDLSLPVENRLDHARWFGKTVVGLIPLAGGPITEIYDKYVPNSLESRKQIWRSSVVERIDKMGLDIEKLKSDEHFLSTMIQCSIEAIGQYDDEVIQALLNAIESAARGGYEKTLQMLFLHYLKQFTSFQIRYLKAVRDAEPKEDMMGYLCQTVLDGNRGLSTVIHEELEVAKGLITYNKDKQLQLSETGVKFMEFITSSIEERT